MIASRLDRRRKLPEVPFTYTIDTTKGTAGLTHNTRIPVTYAIQQINWGDGTIDTNRTHTYATHGTYTITVKADVEWYFDWNGWNDSLHLTSIDAWGESIGTTSSLFNGCTNLTSVASGTLPPSVTHIIYWFYGCTSLTNMGALTGASVTSCFHTWRQCTSLTTMPVCVFPNCTNYGNAWRDCSALTSWASGWDFTSATSFFDTWYGAFNLASNVVFPANNTTGNVTNWDGIRYSKIYEFGSQNMQGLTAVSSGTGFGVTGLFEAWSSIRIFRQQDLRNCINFGRAWYNAKFVTFDAWIPNTTAPAIDMHLAFWSCTNLVNLTLPDLSNVNKFAGTWYNCTALTSFPSISVAGATRLDGTWANCSSLTSIGFIDTTTITKMQTMLYDTVNYGTFWPDFGMLENTRLTSIPNWNYSNVTHFHSTFQDIPTVNTQPPAVISANCIEAVSLFANCTLMPSLPMMNTSNCTKLESLLTYNSVCTSVPHYDTSKCTSIRGLYDYLSGVTSIPLYNTALVTNFENSFRSMGLTSFPALNTSSGTNFKSIFSGYKGTTLPLLDTSNGTMFDYFTYNATALTTMPLFDFSKGTTFLYAFMLNTSLTSFPAVNVGLGTTFFWAWKQCTGLTSFPALNFAEATNMEAAWQTCTGLNGFNFPTHAFPKVTRFVNCWNGVKISTQSCTDLLIAIEAGNAVMTNANLNLGTANYFAAASTARANLVARPWTVTTGAMV